MNRFGSILRNRTKARPGAEFNNVFVALGSESGPVHLLKVTVNLLVQIEQEVNYVSRAKTRTPGCTLRTSFKSNSVKT